MTSGIGVVRVLAREQDAALEGLENDEKDGAGCVAEED